jgi:hypothetical protein
VSKFGKILISRPAGRDAFLSARAYTIPKKTNEIIELDFSGVQVLTPSWADEFIRGLREEFSASRINVIEGDNLSVKTTFETLEDAYPKIV